MKRRSRILGCVLCAIVVIGLLLIQGIGVTESKAYTPVKTLDISTGNLYCVDTNYLFRISGTSDTNTITIEGGRPEKPVQVDLDGVHIDLHRENDGDSIEAAPITIKSGSYVTLYIGKDSMSENYLYGGNKHGIGKNTGYAGLCIEENAHVTIKGCGSLYAHGGGVEYGAAGIGGNYDQDLSDLVIEGGVEIQAVGAHSAPGIGAGRDGVLNNLTIKSGEIVAQGGKYAPGIGAGDAVGSGSGGNTYGITISGGTITATGGYHAAGIGGSEGGKVENITISGGMITATGGENAAGIGSEAGDCKNITISGGNIKAIGGEDAAGIGSGRDAKMTNLSISNGIIIANGGKNGAGIGSGNHVGSGDGGNLEGLQISGGEITATGGENGAGIGGGDGGSVKGIDISGDRWTVISATGGKNGAGIGSANSAVDDISIAISGSNITATGGENGAGIGGGYGDTAKITITGSGTIVARGGIQAAGIGGGKNSESGEIRIEGAEISGTDNRSLSITAEANCHTGTGAGNEAAAIGSGRATGGNITIRNAVLELQADGGGAAIGTGQYHGTTRGTIHKISIDNCKINAKGENKLAAGIGAGLGSTVDSIEIKNSEYTGGVIGSSCYWNHFLENQNEVKDITIENSVIYAAANRYANTPWAGIGSGPWGSVGSITIKDSNVIAKGENGGAGIGTGGWASSKTIVEYYGGNMGDIEITGSTVIAEAQKGGAGIGGGFETSVNDITLKDSTVTATNFDNKTDGAAGIGGGAREGAGNIRIQNCTVTATGGKDSAGIGCSGEDSIVTTMFNTKVKGIYISDNSKVTARGGANGAGIGTGKGGRISEIILIEDSEVEATGGENAAGIGGGANGAGGRGGDLEALTLRGKCKITANGGYGGAGIGGGMDGAANNITISLTTTPDLEYYVKATGGTGAAGIGSGGVVCTGEEVFAPTGHTTDKVTIEGGHIVARGGGLLYGGKDWYYRLGTGAGIGGGARYGVLHNLTITGGYIEAYAGGTDANDIGHGGAGNIDTLYHDKNFKISGGTILANRWTDETSPVITGGSISANLTNAKNSDGKKVYRTTLTLVREANTPVENLQAVVNGYGSKDIFSDGNQKIYLYLPESSEKASWADVTVNGEKRHYYGTTSTDGNGVLKMDGVLSFLEPDEEIVAGKDFVLQLDDATLEGRTYEYETNGVVSLVEVQQATSPGVTLKLHADQVGRFSVTAKENTSSDPVYWELQGEYSGTITREEGSIQITENPSKTYDGQAVEDPEVEKNGDGAVTYTYYAGSNTDGEALADAPVNAGTYTVVAKAAASEHYTGATSEPLTFTIEERAVTLGMSASASGTEATITASLMGAVDNPGSIQFTVTENGNQTLVTTTKRTEKVDGDYQASVTFEKVAASEYQVTAEFIPDDSASNYTCTNSPLEQSFAKDRAIRTITIPEIGTKTYGDDAFLLNPSTTNPLDTDLYRYEVVYDEYPNLQDAVAVDASGKVTVQNAGVTWIKITLVDSTGQYYNDAVAYVKVPVQRAALHVTSYATLDGEKVTEAEYGSLSRLEYGLEYATPDFQNGDTAENYNRGLGTLQVVSLPEMLEVSDDAYTIGIAKVGADFRIGDKNYQNVFVSRNYKLVFSEGSITVTPAELTVMAENAQGTWGTEPEYTYQIVNLQPWDSEALAFETLPEAGLDTGKTGGQTYEDLKPGEYPEAVAVTEGILKKNSFGKENYTVKTVFGDLTIDKADAALSLMVESKTYDGKPVEISTSTADGYDGVIRTVYYRVNDEESSTTGRRRARSTRSKELLTEATVNAGTYYAECTASETDHFTGETKGEYFRIEKAEANPETPDLPDLIMKDGLKLQDQKLPAGWAWENPDTALAIGEVRAMAIYTPEDAENYESVTRELTFRVEAASSGDDRKTDPTIIHNGGGGSPGTGDSAQSVGWLLVLLLASGTLGFVVKRGQGARR